MQLLEVPIAFVCECGGSARVADDMNAFYRMHHVQGAKQAVAKVGGLRSLCGKNKNILAYRSACIYLCDTPLAVPIVSAPCTPSDVLLVHYQDSASVALCSSVLTGQTQKLYEDEGLQQVQVDEVRLKMSSNTIVSNSTLNNTRSTSTQSQEHANQRHRNENHRNQSDTHQSLGPHTANDDDTQYWTEKSRRGQCRARQEQCKATLEQFKSSPQGNPLSWEQSTGED